VSLWGSGTPRREFLFVDDLAQALLHLLSLESPPDWVNIGTGQDISILELAHLVAKTVGYQGQITLDPSKPDGTPLKRTDPTLINSTGWQAETPLELGLRKTLQDFLSRKDQGILRSK
jgi:GDP-L-fucose synthase